mgnify:CR=1 FL=1
MVCSSLWAFARKMDTTLDTKEERDLFAYVSGLTMDRLIAVLG